MSKSKIEKRLPEPQPNKEQKADGTSVRPAIAKPNVIGSQSPPKLFTAIDLLNAVGDALISYRTTGTKPYSIVTNFEFPNDTYEKFMTEIKNISQSVDKTEILYAGFKFSVKKVD